MALTKVTGGLLGNLPTGTSNVAVGDTALDSIASGATDNVAIGSAAGTALTTGTFNTLLGGLSGDALTQGTRNVGLGYNALGSDTLGSKSVAIGLGALGDQNFTSATDALNTAVGHGAGGAVTTGIENTIVGARAGDALGTGQENAVFGQQALSADTAGNHSTAIGHGALFSQNFTSSTDSNNTAVGFSAGASVSTGTQNTLIGGNTGDALTTGSQCTFIGMNAGGAATTGTFNAFLGRSSGSAMTTGAKNTIIGSYNGNQGGFDIRTSSNNIVLSDGDGNGRFRANASGQVVVGDSVSSFGGSGYANTGFTVNQDSNDYITALRVNTSTAGSAYGLFIDYTLVTPNNGQNNFITVKDSTAIRFLVKSNGGINNYQANDANLSDERVKKDISLLGSMWDKFKAIEIVNFKYKDQTHEDFNIGVIAQQLESVAPEFIDNSGFGETPEGEDPLKAVFTADLYHATIKALQEAMTRIETLEAEVTALKEG